MKRFRLILLLLSAIVAVVFIFFAIHSEQRLQESIASVAVPASQGLHERLVVARATPKSAESVPKDLKPTLDIIAQWSVLLDERLGAPSFMVMDEWWARWEEVVGHPCPTQWVWARQSPRDVPPAQARRCAVEICAAWSVSQPQSSTARQNAGACPGGAGCGLAV